MHENRNYVFPVNVYSHSLCAPQFLGPHDTTVCLDYECMGTKATQVEKLWFTGC